jgi:hypothetical protein
MINVNELRIGNNVLDEYGNVSIINTISYGVRISNDKYKWESKSEDQIHPIPLTDELLLECGFEKNNRIDLGELKPCYSNFSLALMIRHNSYFVDWVGGNTEIKYLHELQNLYFSLTKTELKIENYEKTNTKT